MYAKLKRLSRHNFADANGIIPPEKTKLSRKVTRHLRLVARKIKQVSKAGTWVGVDVDEYTKLTR